MQDEDEEQAMKPSETLEANVVPKTKVQARL